MIDLNIQIKMIIFSCIYGIFLYFFMNSFKNIIYNKNKKIQIIFTITFFLTNATLYFLILKKLNDAIIDRNLLIMLLVGLYLGHALRKLTIRTLKTNKHI